MSLILYASSSIFVNSARSFFDCTGRAVGEGSSDGALIGRLPRHRGLISVISVSITIAWVFRVVVFSSFCQGLIVGLGSDLDFLAWGLSIRQLGLRRLRLVSVFILIVK